MRNPDDWILRYVRTSLFKSSNDIRPGNMGSHDPSKERASSRTHIDEKECVKHHIPGQKNKHLGKRKDNGHRSDLTSQETQVDLGGARQEDTRQSMDTAYHPMDTLRKESI